MTGGVDMQTEGTIRVTATLPPEMMMRACYWAKKHDMSINQYLVYALEQFIKWDGADHTKPTKETERLNLCVDTIEELAGYIHGLQTAIDSGFDALSEATRGDSEFLKPEDGSLDRIDLTAKAKHRKRHRKG